jgi:isopentenyl-diphosphate delta-isomerase
VFRKRLSSLHVRQDWRLRSVWRIVTVDEVASRPVSVRDITADLDPLILVDAADRDVGHLSKARCHEGKGILHRAFSLFIFNGAGELLIQQRGPSKRLWPLYWSNSCCSHPRSGESMDAATQRRLDEELGISCPLQFLFKFQYQAQFDATGSEHELCSVFIGTCSDPIIIDRSEILAWRWVSPEVLQAQMNSREAGPFTPWFKMEWARIWCDHREAVLALRPQN